MIFRFAFLLTLSATVCLRAQTPPARQPELTADRSEFRGGEAFYEGNARIADGAQLLVADRIVYQPTTQTAVATGNVAFTRGEVRLLADRLVYRLETGAFSAENIRLGSHPYFVEGASAAGSRTEITVQKATLSYGEPGPWQPTIAADSIVFSPGQQFRMVNMSAGIGSMQPIPIPRFEQNLRTPLVGSVNLNGGYRSSLGVFLEATVHAPVKPGLRLGADVGLYSNRGFMVGPSGRYEDPKNAAALRGFFRSGYINDHGDKGFDRLNRRVPEERAFLEWQHEQLLAPNLTLRAQANAWTDSEVVRDFRPRAFFPVQEPDTFAEAVYTGGNYFVSLFTRFQPNSFQRVQERLPELRFDLLPSALGEGFYHRFNAGAAVLREDPLGPGPTLRSDRLDAYYSVFRPIAAGDAVTFTPVVGGRLTHYANSTGPVRTGSYTRALGEAGFDAAVRFSGVFDYRNPQWKIDGLRHLLTPRLSYRYVPEADRGVDRIARIDRESFSTYLQPLGLAEVRNVDDLRATNTLRLSLENLLQTRDRAEGSRDLVWLNLANDFRFKRRAGERDVSETHVDLALTPARWLQVDVYQSFAPQSFTLRELNSGITLRDGAAWSVRFGNNFLRSQIQDYSFEGRRRLNERLEALTRLHYDARRHRFNEQSYGLAQNLGNTWLISYTVSLYSGRRRESGFGFNIQIDTVRF